MDWSLCAICQQKSNDEVLYPCKGKKINALDVYKNFFNNVAEFQQLQALPCELAFDEERSLLQKLFLTIMLAGTNYAIRDLTTRN